MVRGVDILLIFNLDMKQTKYTDQMLGYRGTAFILQLETVTRDSVYLSGLDMRYLRPAITIPKLTQWTTCRAADPCHAVDRSVNIQHS